MSEDKFINGMTFDEYMNRESEFADVSRALLMARYNNDFKLKTQLLEQVGIKYDANDNSSKMIDWLINLANSFAMGLAAVTEKSVPDLVMMDASAFYKVQSVIYDRLNPDER